MNQIILGTIVSEEGKEKKVSIDFEPPFSLRQSMTVIDSKFHVEVIL